MRMKKKLSLFLVALLSITAFAATQALRRASSTTVTYALSEGDSFTSGQTVDVKNGDEVVATITYGESGGADFAAATAEGSVKGFTASTAGNGTNGNKPGGTFYTIVPQYDGTITVAVALNAGKAFHIQENGADLASYAGITVSEKYLGTYEFEVKAGKSYKVYCDGSKLGFYGFSYTYEKSINKKFDITYALSEGDSFTSGQTVDVKNGDEVVAKITYGESGGADFAAATAEGSVKGFTASTAGNGTNGNKPGGTFYTIVPQYDGTITVAVALNADKAFHIQENGADLASYAGITVSEKYLGTYEFEVKAGKSYKVYCDGSKLGFYGFSLIKLT